MPSLAYLKGMSVDKLDYYIGSYAQAGHVASNRFLMDFVDTLRKNFRETKLLYRISGDYILGVCQRAELPRGDPKQFPGLHLRFGPTHQVRMVRVECLRVLKHRPDTLGR